MNLKETYESHPVIIFSSMVVTVFAIASSVVGFILSNNYDIRVEGLRQICESEKSSLRREIENIKISLSVDDFFDIRSMVFSGGLSIGSVYEYFPDDLFYANWKSSSLSYKKVTNISTMALLTGELIEIPLPKSSSELYRKIPGPSSSLIEWAHVWRDKSRVAVMMNGKEVNLSPRVIIQRKKVNEVESQVLMGDIYSSYVKLKIQKSKESDDIDYKTEVIRRDSEYLYSESVTEYNFVLGGRFDESYKNKSVVFVRQKLIMINLDDSLYVITSIVPSVRPVAEPEVDNTINKFLAQVKLYSRL